MKTYFADSFYYLALLSPADAQHARAVAASRELRGWSLTDCISFVTMREMAVAEALTGDRHFEQAGFIALLK